MHEQREFPGASPDHWLTTPPPEYDEHDCDDADVRCGECGVCLECYAHESDCPTQGKTADWHFGVDADLLDTIEDGPAGPDCPCARCGAQFRPTVRP